MTSQNENQTYLQQAERYAKGFTSWNQFVAMLFWQTAQAKNLREVSGGLACCILLQGQKGVSV